MTVREFAKLKKFEIVGKLKRIHDVHCGVIDRHYPCYMDEAGNEYWMDFESDMYCIITTDGGII